MQAGGQAVIIVNPEEHTIYYAISANKKNLSFIYKEEPSTLSRTSLPVAQ